MTDLISVVVTCYNHEDYIKQCLESIFKQTYKNIELYVFNDGSTDKSPEIIAETLQHSPFACTQFISHDNQGVVPTRNQAFDLAQGKYLLFVDSDNFLQANYVEELYQTAQSEQADIVYAPLINPDNHEQVVAGGAFNLERFIEGNFIDMCSLIRTSIIGETRFDNYFNYKGVEDYDFFMTLILDKQAKAVFCDSTFLNYRVLDASLSTRGNFKKYYHLYAYILNKHIVTYPKEVGRALTYHFNRLTKLDIEHSIKEEYLEVYLANSTDFPEQPQYKFPIRFKDCLSLAISEGYSHLRVRPSHIPSFYENFKVSSQTYQTEFLPNLSNGIVDGYSVIFEDFHPFIDYKINIKEGDNLLISYKRYNINDIVAQDYIAKCLARDKFNRKEELNQLEAQTTHLISSLKAELSQKYNDYHQLSQDYHTVIGSRRWTIPTKIINFFRRKK